MLVDPDAYRYLPVLLLMLVGAVVGSILLLGNVIFGTKPKEDVEPHRDVYECGVPYQGNARQQFSVRYYVIGIVFLLFDVEVVFTYPWVLVYRKLLASGGAFVLYEMIVFSCVLVATYFYLLKRGGLNWD